MPSTRLEVLFQRFDHDLLLADDVVDDQRHLGAALGLAQHHEAVVRLGLGDHLEALGQIDDLHIFAAHLQHLAAGRHPPEIGARALDGFDDRADSGTT